MGKIAFVTGGTGFVGSHLVEALLERGYSEIRCLVRSEPKWLNGLDIVPIRGSLHDSTKIKRALQDVDFVYHLGAMTRARTWDKLYEANVVSTMSLMAEAKAANIPKICVASSLAVVGNAGEMLADESTSYAPVSMYGQSKLIMEYALADADLPTVIVRPPVVYGPRDRDLLSFFAAVNRGLCVAPQGDTGLSLVYVKDLVRGIIAATESPRTTGETYYIGNQRVISWEQLQKSSESALGKTSRMIRVPRSLIMLLGTVSELAGRLSRTYPALNREKAREILHATKQCSSEKAREHFGYVSEVSLDNGVKETIAWYRAQDWL